MKRIDFYRAKLKANRSELRSMARTIKTILDLEKKIDALLAKT